MSLTHKMIPNAHYKNKKKSQKGDEDDDKPIIKVKF